MVERISQKLLESETRQKSREVKDTQTLRMWCIEQALQKLPPNPPGITNTQLIETAHAIENYIVGRVVSS